MQALDGSEELNAGTVLEVLGKFVYLFVASMGLGLAFGLGTSLLMKVFKSHSTPQVCLITFMQWHIEEGLNHPTLLSTALPPSLSPPVGKGSMPL